MAGSGIVRKGNSGYTYDFGIAIARSTIQDLGILSAKALTLTAAIYGLSTTMLGMEDSLKRNKLIFGGYINTLQAMQFAQNKLLSGATQFDESDIMDGMRHIQNAGLDAKKTFDFVNRAAEATGQSFAEMGSMLEGAINSGNFGSMVQLGIMTQNQTKYFERYTAGTNAMRSAVMRFMTSNKTLANAMKNTMTTIRGQLTRMKGFSLEFARAIVGNPTDPNSFYNQIKNTITMINSFLFKHLPEIRKFGFTIGLVLSFIVRNVMGLIKFTVNFFGRMIGNIRLFMGNFQNNIMSMLLWLELVKQRIISIFKRYKDEIMFAIKAIVALWVAWKVFSLMSMGAYALGKALRYGVGGFGLMARMFPGFSIKLAKIKWAFYEVRAAIISAWRSMITFVRGITFESILAGLRAVTVAAWEFVVAVAANPITWIVVAVIALVAWTVYLVRNWNQVRKSTQGWGDTLLSVTAILLPIVGIPLLMAKHWEKLKAITINVWRIIKNLTIGSWIAIKNAFKNAIDFMGQYIGPILKPITWLFTTIWDGIKGFIEWIKSAVNDGWIGKLLGKMNGVLKNAADSSAQFANSQAAGSQFKEDKMVYGGGVDYKSEPDAVPTKDKKPKDKNPILNAMTPGASQGAIGTQSGAMSLQPGAVVINVNGSRAADPQAIAREVRKILQEMNRTTKAREGNG